MIDKGIKSLHNTLNHMMDATWIFIVFIKPDGEYEMDHYSLRRDILTIDDMCKDHDLISLLYRLITSDLIRTWRITVTRRNP